MESSSEVLSLGVPSLPSSTDAGVLSDTVTVEECAAPQVPEKLTEKQWRQLRRQYVTMTNGTVVACGHKDNFSKTDRRAGKIPNNNCVNCWEAYFMTSVDLEFVHTVITQKGVPELVKVYGTKFTKMFHGFLASKMLPALAAQIKAENESVQIEGGTIGGQQGTEVQAGSITEQAAG